MLLAARYLFPWFSLSMPVAASVGADNGEPWHDAAPVDAHGGFSTPGVRLPLSSFIRALEG